MKKILFSAGLALLSTGVFAQTKWNLDASHSNVRFTVSHLVISEVEGSFRKFEGNIAHTKPDFTDAAINFTVDVNSINTDNEGRDKHLKGDDFFNAAQYPQMTFKSTSFKKVSGNKYLLAGIMTIRNVSKPVTFDVTYGGTVKDPWGNTKAGFKAKGSVNRFDYGLKWNTMTEAGGAVVGKDIDIDLKLEFAQAK
ncbi:YceI family protein [Flaviaesturariibacter amylovorans]|uniref:YceI family protein n=1 Tax=Flaviaesturariibacter amylovorans TaxID=1084520 RepID=A0ABP8HK14_9BACT